MGAQLYQPGLRLQPDTTYRLRFAAKSSNGQDMSIFLHRHRDPYTNYGLRSQVVELTEEWSWHDLEFTTTGFSAPVEDGRLRFWLAGNDVDGMTYQIDHVMLFEATGAPVPTPPVPTTTPIPTATPMPTATATPPLPETPTPTPTPDECGPQGDNILQNSNFENGKAGWQLYTNGKAVYQTPGGGYECSRAAQIDIVRSGSNAQFYQAGLLLEPDTAYHLKIAAKSSNGQDMGVFLHRHDAPYTHYGLNGVHLDLTQEWRVFQIEFTTTGFSAPVANGRLRFHLAPYDDPGTVYRIDSVVLEKVDAVGELEAAGQSALLYDQGVHRLISGDFIDDDDRGWQAGTTIAGADWQVFLPHLR